MVQQKKSRRRSRLWVWLARFAYRRAVSHNPLNKVPTGLPGHRDPEHPCTSYSPVNRRNSIFRPPYYSLRGDCQSDGHYLCNDCRWLDPKSDFAQFNFGSGVTED